MCYYTWLVGLLFLLIILIKNFFMISPLNTENSPPSTSLLLTGAPYNVPLSQTTYNGLLRFPKIDSLNLETDTNIPAITPMMTVALAPLEGSVTVYAQVSCCTPTTPKFLYADSLFVPNLWVWKPTFYFKAADDTPLSGYSITISANELNAAPSYTCQTTTDSDGKAQCQLATSLPDDLSKLSLNAQFNGASCLYNAITSSVQVTVFGFPDNGHHAFVVSNSTGNKKPGDKVVFSGLDWLFWNPFGDHDSRSSSARGLSLTLAKTLNLNFGGYVIADLTTPTCAGSFSWKVSLLNSLPKTLPTNLGVLVADNLGGNGIFNGAWSKILVLENIKYYSTFGFLNSYGYFSGTYCTGTSVPPAATTPIPTTQIPTTTKKPTTPKPTTKKPTTKKPTTKKPTTKKPTTTTKKPNNAKGNGH
jgi:hypothetical protein